MGSGEVLPDDILTLTISWTRILFWNWMNEFDKQYINAMKRPKIIENVCTQCLSWEFVLAYCMQYVP